MDTIRVTTTPQVQVVDAPPAEHKGDTDWFPGPRYDRDLDRTDRAHDAYMNSMRQVWNGNRR